MRVGIAVVPGCFDSGITAMLDVLRTAEGLKGFVDPSIDPIGATVLASGDRVATAAGLELVTQPLEGAAAPDFDVLCVPGIGVATPPELETAVASKPVRELRGWLRANAPDVPRVTG